MITLRPSQERGHADHGWLDTYHTFSFANYYDPRHMGFRHLRVINEDRVDPSEGFGTHPHRDMEIVTVVLEGALEHRDSMGNGEVIRAGDVQRMTAGTGVLHSEVNPSDTEPVHLMQIWILPEQAGLTPGYEQQTVPEAEKRGRWRIVASRDGREGAMRIHQDVAIALTVLDPGEERTYPLKADRHAWVQVLRGTLSLNGIAMHAGDGAAVSAEERLMLRADSPAEVMLFDLA